MPTPKWKAALQKRKEAKDASDVKAFKLPNGKTTLRILPNPKDPLELFYHDFGQHWIKSKDEKNAQGKPKIVGAPLCMTKAYEEECPYCDALSEAKAHIEDNQHDFSDEEIELLEEARARHRVLINAAVRNKGGYEVHMIDLPTTAFNAMIDIITEYGDEMVADEGGIDIVMNRSGTGINTTYTAMPAKNHGSDIDESWKDDAVDLAAYVKSQIPSAPRAATAIAGVGKIANISTSAPALSAPSSKRPAIESKSENKSVEKQSSVLEDDLDDSLDDELDDVPFEEESAVEPEKQDDSNSNEDHEKLLDELDSELDDLENV